MWLFSFLSVSILNFIAHTLVSVGVVGLIAGFFSSKIPPISSYGSIIKIAAVISLLAGVFFEGYSSMAENYEEKLKEFEEKIKVVEEKSNTVNEVIKERIVYKNKIVNKKTVEYVDRIKEIAKEVDAKCEVDPRIIEQLNKAAEQPK